VRQHNKHIRYLLKLISKLIGLFIVVMLLTSTIFAGSSLIPIYAQGDAESQNGKTDEFPSCLNVAYVPPCVDDDGSKVFSCDDPRHLEFENQGCAPESSNQSTDISGGNATAEFGGNMTGFGEFPADEFGGNMTGDFGFENATDQFGGNMTGDFGFENATDQFGGNMTDQFGGNATDTANNLTGVVLGN
jgi:hypothetical protein